MLGGGGGARASALVGLLARKKTGKGGQLVFGKMVFDRAPVNVLKDGADPPLKPNAEYPAWLWKQIEPRPTLGELKRQPLLTEGELTRMVRLMNKEHIKANNNALRKSK